MFKAVILLKRRDDTSPEEFAQWWLGDHAPLAKGLPGVRGATFNLVAGDGSGAFDGVSELWFDDQAAFEAAYKGMEERLDYRRIVEAKLTAMGAAPAPAVAASGAAR